MTIYDPHGVIHIKCSGKPLEGPYLPPQSDLLELGRYLASKYAYETEPEVPRDEERQV